VYSVNEESLYLGMGRSCDVIKVVLIRIHREELESIDAHSWDY